jgi:hypothetical protein
MSNCRTYESPLLGTAVSTIKAAGYKLQESHLYCTGFAHPRKLEFMVGCSQDAVADLTSESDSMAATL